MKKLSSIAALVTAALIAIAAESAWSNEAWPDRSARQTPVPVTGSAAGRYPPPGRGGYAQPWQYPAQYRPAAPAMRTPAPMTGFVPGPYAPQTGRSGYAQPRQQASQYRPAAPAMRTPAPMTGFVPGPYAPPSGRGGYAQPRQQALQWPAPPRNYTRIPPRGQSRIVPAAPATSDKSLRAELEQTQEQLIAKSTELDKTHAALEQSREKLQQRFEAELALNEKLANITSEQLALQAHVTELTTELNTTSATLEQNRRQISNDQQQYRMLTEERDRLHSDLAGRDKQLATLQTELQAATQTLEQTRSEATTARQLLEETRAQAGMLNNKLSELTTRLESQKTALLRDVQPLTAERDSLRSDLASRDEQLAALQAELQSVTQTLEQARSEATGSGQLLNETRVQTQMFKNRLNRVMNQLMNHKTILQDTEQTLTAMTAERDDLQADLAACSRERTRARDALTTARSEADALGRTRPATTRVSVAPAVAPPGSDKVKPPTSKELVAGTVTVAPPQIAATDADADGVADSRDLCLGTPRGIVVDSTGCAAGVAINLEDVNFLFNSHQLTDKARGILNRVAGILVQQPGLRLEVAGHTDAQGNPAYNKWLSLKRAETVRDYLVARGVNADHLGAAGYGGQRPIADNSTREGLRKNRRVELHRLE